MKIRHPSAIVLILWYIMIPPLVMRSGVPYMQSNVTAPLAEWRAMQLEDGTILDSERTCENYRSTAASKVSKGLTS